MTKIQMGVLATGLAFSLGGSTALASGSELGAIRCEYRVSRPDKPDFVMSGVLDSAELERLDDASATYLTLEPPVTAGIANSARVLITVWNYHPMTLHPRGDTSKAIAAGQLDKDESVSTTDEAGVRYELRCLALSLF